MATTTATGGAPPVSRQPPAPTAPRLHAAVQRLAGLAVLDGVAGRVGAAARGVVRPGPVRDALSGRALGHALHPLLTDLPIGTWTSASLLDALGGRGRRGRPARRRAGLSLRRRRRRAPGPP
jgi:hypothetical protein